MNLAVSNFAWDYNESEKTFAYFNELGIRNVELVLTKYKTWDELSDLDVRKYKVELENMNMTPYSLQSLFYNVNCTISDVELMVNHFKKLIDFSEILGVKVLVFGSPNIRKKLENYETNLVKVFKEVDEYLTGKNIQLAIEPNTLSYGGEYFSKLPEIIEFINSNNLVNVKTMIDTHNLILEKNDPIFEIEKYFDYICHVHVSEPKLDIIKDTTFHREFSKKLKDLNYNKTITYEVNKCDGLTESIKLFSEIYNN